MLARFPRPSTCTPSPYALAGNWSTTAETGKSPTSRKRISICPANTERAGSLNPCEGELNADNFKKTVSLGKRHGSHRGGYGNQSQPAGNAHRVSNLSRQGLD